MPQWTLWAVQPPSSTPKAPGTGRETAVVGFKNVCRAECRISAISVIYGATLEGHELFSGTSRYYPSFGEAESEIKRKKSSVKKALLEIWANISPNRAK